MSISDRAADIRDEFAFLDDWESRYAHIIDMGKGLDDLTDPERIDAYKVPGCASQVWIVPDPDRGAPDEIAFRAGSDAILVSGLIVVLKRLFDGTRATEIKAFDAHGFFAEIGLDQALSAQRANGLNAMLERIRMLANGRAGTG